MSEPITLNPAPFQLRGNINPEQITALINLLASANLIELPTHASWPNAVGMNISVLPNGNGVITINFK
jgi:hypothetical protein